MDHSSAQYQQQQQLQQNHLTYEASSSSSSSQMQMQMQAYQYDYSSNQAYNNYPYNQYYHHQQQQQQPYPYYTQHDYTNTTNSYYQTTTDNQQEEESLIFPPGVPPPQQITTTHDVQNHQYYNYPNSAIGAVSVPGGSHHHHPSREMGTLVKGQIDPPKVRDMQHHLQQQPMIPQGAPQPSHASTSGSVRRAVKGQFHSAKVRPPRPMAWCELCRVDCNSLEILEQHKNGKKHKKNLKVHDELQNLNKLLIRGQNEQSSVPEPKTGIHNQSEKVEGSGGNPLPQENLSFQTAVTEEKDVELGQQKVEEADNKVGLGVRTGKNNVETRGRGLKRKMKGERGGKRMRSYDGSRRPIEPPKPKEVIPLICELCNVKCESNVVFQSHLKGKKHIANFKRFQDQQTMIGQAALQALYPALQALYPALQELCQGDIGALVSQLQQQGALGLPGFSAQSGPSSTVFQGQASEAAPATLSELPQSSTFSQEQPDFQLEGSKAAHEIQSQGASVTESISKEQSVSADHVESDPRPDSNAGHLESKTEESVEY